MYAHAHFSRERGLRFKGRTGPDSFACVPSKQPSPSMRHDSRSPFFPVRPVPGLSSPLVPSHGGTLRDPRPGRWFGRLAELPLIQRHRRWSGRKKGVPKFTEKEVQAAIDSVKMWVATVHIAEAFDTMRHRALWKGPLQDSKSRRHTSNSKRLHADQQATVLTEKESGILEMQRRTKQGDALSSLLFNTLFQAALECDLTRRRETGMGLRLGDQQADCFSNLRLADDVFLFSTSLEQLRRMMSDLKKHTESGDENPPGQGKISTTKDQTREWKCRSTTFKCGSACERMCEVPRTNTTLEQQETAEIKSRIRAAWASFPSTNKI